MHDVALQTTQRCALPKGQRIACSWCCTPSPAHPPIPPTPLWTVFCLTPLTPLSSRSRHETSSTVPVGRRAGCSTTNTQSSVPWAMHIVVSIGIVAPDMYHVSLALEINRITKWHNSTTISQVTFIGLPYALSCHNSPQANPRSSLAALSLSSSSS